MRHSRSLRRRSSSARSARRAADNVGLTVGLGDKSFGLQQFDLLEVSVFPPEQQIAKRGPAQQKAGIFDNIGQRAHSEPRAGYSSIQRVGVKMQFTDTSGGSTGSSRTICSSNATPQ